MQFYTYILSSSLIISSVSLAMEKENNDVLTDLAKQLGTCSSIKGKEDFLKYVAVRFPAVTSTNLVVQKKMIAPFEKLIVSDGIQAILLPITSESREHERELTIRGNSDFIDYMLISHNDTTKTLELKVHPIAWEAVAVYCGMWERTPLEVRIATNNIKSITTFENSLVIISQEEWDKKNYTLKVPHLRAIANNKSTILLSGLNIEKKLTTESRHDSLIIVEGSAKKHTAIASNNVRGIGATFLESEVAKVCTYNNAHVHVNPKNELIAYARDTSKIYYAQEPKTIEKETLDQSTIELESCEIITEHFNTGV